MAVYNRSRRLPLSNHHQHPEARQLFGVFSCPGSRFCPAAQMLRLSKQFQGVFRVAQPPIWKTAGNNAEIVAKLGYTSAQRLGLNTDQFGKFSRIHLEESPIQNPRRGLRPGGGWFLQVGWFPTSASAPGFQGSRRFSTISAHISDRLPTFLIGA